MNVATLTSPYLNMPPSPASSNCTTTEHTRSMTLPSIKSLLADIDAQTRARHVASPCASPESHRGSFSRQLAPLPGLIAQTSIHPVHYAGGPIRHYEAEARPTRSDSPTEMSSAASASSFSGAGRDRYVCEQCFKPFSRPSSLKIHLHSHTGERPFSCTVAGCDKSFSVRSNLRRHLKTHA
ncbi:hypothetical protein PYCC9005_005575 [Savitreella phatthalungensis]